MTPRYEAWYRRRAAGGQSSLRVLASRPGALIFLLPWVLVVLPLAALPREWIDAMGGASLAQVTAAWIPMIDAVARPAANPERVRYLLGILWGTAPAWTLVTAVLLVAIGRRRLDALPPPAGAGVVLAGLLFFSLAAIMIANIGPRLWKRVDVVQMVFSQPGGLFTVGWFVIAAPFIALGIVLAHPFLRALPARRAAER